ncbi:Hypothetical predicted protein [Octopus vulgaris]|uniref:Uncharacterized protein n=1 Tax=Octopus vulgaris TaxID=6645 RepID=A0AA36BLY4_OCTVU|nr:Hypothetical predicted protein [Octopus vulgaris]
MFFTESSTICYYPLIPTAGGRGDGDNGHDADNDRQGGDGVAGAYRHHGGGDGGRGGRGDCSRNGNGILFPSPSSNV